MAGILSRAVARLKERVHQFLSVSAVTQAAAALNLHWRQTVLAVPNLVVWFARQILGGNLSMAELSRLAGSIFTPEAYCQARTRLSLQLLRELLQRIRSLGEGLTGSRDPLLWKGHRLWHMDGSSFSMPDTPELQTTFGQPARQRKACGFPVAHILCLFDAATGLIQDCILSPLRTHDLAKAAQLHPLLRAGDILIADRAFESFVHAALLLGQGLHLLTPVHQRRKVDFRRGQRLGGRNGCRMERRRLRRCGPCDQVVRWFRPQHKPRWMAQEQYDVLPQSIDMREVKRVVVLPDGRKQTIVMVTTLLDEKRYAAEELVDLLKDRWAVEVNLRHLKTTMKMEVLRSKTVPGVEKELWMFLIVYNMVRLIMLEASAKQQVPLRRISFADALYWLRHGDLSGPIPPLLVNPERPRRAEPRVIKRRPKPYSFMCRPRSELRKLLRKCDRKELF